MFPRYEHDAPLRARRASEWLLRNFYGSSQVVYFVTVACTKDLFKPQRPRRKRETSFASLPSAISVAFQVDRQKAMAPWYLRNPMQKDVALRAIKHFEAFSSFHHQNDARESPISFEFSKEFKSMAQSLTAAIRQNSCFLQNEIRLT